MNAFKEEKTMHDRIEKFGKGTTIQHGKLNNRIYLIKLNEKDVPAIFDYFDILIKEAAYTKIFCKVPSWVAPIFISKGFITEAGIPDFYNQKEAVFFMSKFLNSDRLLNIEHEKLKELSSILSTKKASNNPEFNEDFRTLQLNSSHVEQITSIYKQVFESYPFPIHKNEYILKTMNEGVQYFGVEKDGKLIALSSSEVDKKSANAEMTDFATLPEFRGKKLSILLLLEMENAMKTQNITTLYTIARLNSIPMNKTFLNLGYIYSGTLINNTNIAGKIESMNVWYKHI